MENPTGTSVYFYYDSADVLLYVGITSRATRRQSEHNSTKEWWPFVASQRVEHYASRPEAMLRERGAIREYRPPFNVQHNPDHDVCRLAYFAFRDAAGSVSSRTELVRQLDRKVPLILLRPGSSVATYTTSPLAAPIAGRLIRGPGKVKAISGGNYCGTVRSVKAVGMRAEIEMTVTKDYARGAAPFARIRTLNTQDGRGTLYEVKNIQVCESHEQAAFAAEKRSA